MNIGATFIADFQAAEAIQPAQGALHNPTVKTEPMAAVHVASRDAWRDAPATQGLAGLTTVVRLVSVQLGRSFAGSAPAATQRGNGIDHRLQHPTVMDIGPRMPYRQGDALSVDHKMALRARFAAVCRVATGSFAPPGAGTLPASRDARDQSMCPAWESRSNNALWMASHTPAACQSRSRRQQVIPLPQPISWGSISHGIPLFKTNRMPVKAARFDARGRPPFGFGGSAGSSGSITAHNSSLTSGCAISLAYQVGFC